MLRSSPSERYSGDVLGGSINLGVPMGSRLRLQWVLSHSPCMDAYILEIGDLLTAISRRSALEMEDLRIKAALIDKRNVIEASQNHDNTSLDSKTVARNWEVFQLLFTTIYHQNNTFPRMETQYLATHLSRLKKFNALEVTPKLTHRSVSAGVTTSTQP